MKMYKDGIYREIPDKKVSEYKELGFKIVEETKPSLDKLDDIEETPKRKKN